MKLVLNIWEGCVVFFSFNIIMWDMTFIMLKN